VDRIEGRFVIHFTEAHVHLDEWLQDWHDEVQRLAMDMSRSPGFILDWDRDLYDSAYEAARVEVRDVRFN
jgi:hypothetical protein